MTLLLAIDVGNTNIVAGLYRHRTLINHWRLPTRRDATADELGLQLYGLFGLAGISPGDVTGVAISSVVPPLGPVLEETARRYFACQPLVVGPGIRTGIDIRYEDPREVGADRIANAVAAYARWGGPCIVVDFGTATTFDAISAEGVYLGGAIAPGIGISAEALVEKAARLHPVELVRPKSIIGRNTVSSMQAGIIYGFVGQVDGICRRMREELGGQAHVVATGGLASLVAPDSATIEFVEPMLTLEGLRLIYERNHEN